MKLFITLTALAMLFGASLSVRAESPVTVRLIIEQEGIGQKGIGQEEVLIDLLDNPAAKAFAAQLPLTLPFRDYAGEEKIATLPTRLSAKGSPSAREMPVDFTYFTPWGNLAVFYNHVGDDGQLLALGRIRSGKAVLAGQRGDFTARLERVER